MPTNSTHFTQTGPSAASRGTRLDLGPAPPNETPSQKVARLRAAAHAAKLQQASTWDKIVWKGRLWADRAHRITASGLILISIGFGVYTFLCLGDMMVYNRRKREEFYAVMEKLRADEYASALQAESKGQATDDQMLLINQERARFEQLRIDQERKEKGIWRRMTESVVGTEMKEEPKGGKMGVGRSKKEKPAGVTEAVEGMLAQRDLKVDLNASNSSPTTTGGLLDQTAQQAADSATKSAKSWTSWITGR